MIVGERKPLIRGVDLNAGQFYFIGAAKIVVHAHKNRHIDTANSPAQDRTYEMAIELPRFGQVSLTRVKQAAHMKSRACATFGNRLTAFVVPSA